MPRGFARRPFSQSDFKHTIIDKKSNFKKDTCFVNLSARIWLYVKVQIQQFYCVWFVVSQFTVGPCDLFTHILQHCFTIGTGNLKTVRCPNADKVPWSAYSFNFLCIMMIFWLTYTDLDYFISALYDKMCNLFNDAREELLCKIAFQVCIFFICSWYCWSTADWSAIYLDTYHNDVINGNIVRVTGHLCGEFTGHRWIPRTKSSDAELWCFSDLPLNKRLSKPSWGCIFETPSRQLWRHCNGRFICYQSIKQPASPPHHTCSGILAP